MLQDRPYDYVVFLIIRPDDYVFLIINYYASTIYKPLCINNVFWKQTL